MEAPIFCIVDVQPRFDAAIYVVDEIVRCVNLFRHMDSPIVVVEYSTAGETYEPIMSALDGYSKLYRVTKNQDNGSYEVAKALVDVPSNRIIMAGVNTCYCVRDTAYGLISNHRYKVQLAAKALQCRMFDCDFGGGISCVQHQRLQLKQAERLNGLRKGEI
jgi:hypothetical protein